MKELNLGRWLSGELTEEDLRDFENSEEYGIYTKIADTSATLQAPDFDAQASLESFRNKHIKKETKVIKMSPFKMVYRVAAVAVVLLASYLYINSVDTITNTQAGQTAQLVLPDASNVILNSDSELRFNKRSWADKREVNLKGEAFFKVSKGERFDVNTSGGKVTVLGTQFNVESRDSFFEVSCFEGLVQVVYNKQTVKLPAGNSLLVVNGEVMEQKVAINATPSWMNGQSTFNSVPLGLVIAELERTFNVKVNTQNIRLEQTFSGAFNHKDLDKALQGICIPLDIDFEKDSDGNVTLSEKSE